MERSEVFKSMRFLLISMTLFGLLLVTPALMSARHQDGLLKSKAVFEQPWSTFNFTPARNVGTESSDQAEAGAPAEDQKTLENVRESEPQAAPVNPSAIQGKREHKKIQIDLSDLVIRPV